MAKIDTFVFADNTFSQIPHWVLYSDVSAGAIRLYCVFLHYANRESTAWPSRASLAADIRKSQRSVDLAIDELIAIGAIQVYPRYREDGSQTSNRYKLITSAPLANVDEPPLAVFDEGATQKLRTNYNQLTITNRTITTKDNNSSFDSFWEVYPRKVGKGQARTAFAKALKKATIEEIIEGAQRLASDPNLDLQFCPHPSTWLNGERWTDAPLPGKQSKNLASLNTALNISRQLEERERNNAAIGNC